IVMSDHGFDPGERTHRDAHSPFLVANKRLLYASGDRRDVAPTIYAWLGMDSHQFLPPLPGKSLFSSSVEAVAAPELPLVRIGYFHGGRTGAIYRAFINGYFA